MLVNQIEEEERLEQERLAKLAAVEQGLVTETPEEVIDEVALSISRYRQYRCVQLNPLGCKFARQPTEDLEVKLCQKCNFPRVLSEKSKIRGSRGLYRIVSFLKDRGMGRLYEAVITEDEQPVVIKEFLLPSRCFNPAEARQRQDTFTRIAGMSLVDGRAPDFRIVTPWEAIADVQGDRCYLVMKGTLDTLPTLEAYLEEHGPLTDPQVRQVLNQLLQTLEFLHAQKFRLPSGIIQRGLVHGNLNLGSVLIRVESDRLFVYSTDLAVWEQLFEPPPSFSAPLTPAQDLVDLGYLSFHLLVGRKEQDNGQRLNPENHQHWTTIDPHLKVFILRLMGLDVSFESAEAARQALNQLPKAQTEITSWKEYDETPEKYRVPTWLILLLSGIALISLGVAAWLLFPRFRPPTPASKDFQLCCIRDVSAVPEGSFTYAAERGETWSYVLRRSSAVLEGKLLEGFLGKYRPRFQLGFFPQPSAKDALQKVQANQVDFAIVPATSLVETLLPEEKKDPNAVTPSFEELTAGLEQKIIAYDGIAVFVAFSYAERENSLPRTLKGQITFEQLQKLYTGRIKNWSELGGPDLPVKLYIPLETEAVRIFEQRVLQTEFNIAAFRKLKGSLITPYPTFPSLRQILQDFENTPQVGSISFGAYSRMSGQCSIYPLALVDGQKPPVQLLLHQNGKPVDPSTNLCDEKGSYGPNIQLFQSGNYPLAYPISVFYPRDNSRPPAGEKFAQMIRTEEGQRLLVNSGLVPVQPLPAK